MRRIVGWHASRGEQALARIETQRGRESLDSRNAGHRDERLLRRARATRAELLVAVEACTPACRALTDLWNRQGDSPLGTITGFRVAGLTETRRDDPLCAGELYRELADHAALDVDRRRVRQELTRLERGRG